MTVAAPDKLEFKGFPKIPRLFKDITITEKIDGTNACVVFDEEGNIQVQSRNRIITPDDDNYGFARWAYDNQAVLWWDLGPGYHYGEWWGSGIQRGYDSPPGERYFSLFNTARWSEEYPCDVGYIRSVPVLYEGVLSEFQVHRALNNLRNNGSEAAPGYRNPEGIVVYHHAANRTFKVTLDQNDHHKGLVIE